MTDLDALLQAAATDPAQRPAFLEALLAADIYVLGKLDPPVAYGVADAGSTIKIRPWSDADGEITPFFTSEGALRRALDAHPGLDPAFVRLPARAFLEMLRGQRLMLNPGSFGKVFLPEEVEALLAGGDPGGQTTAVQQDQQVLVGAPAHVPPALPRVLRDYFASRPAVHEAFLGWIVNPAQGPDGHYLVVVVSDDRDAAMSGFGALQIGEVTDGRLLDVIVTPPGADHLLANLEPIYRRPV